MKAEAFCPGHITGFFQICEGKTVLSTGSRGAGLCLALGATSTIRCEESSRQSVEVKIDGRASDAGVTKVAVRELLGVERAHVEVDTRLDLPQSQGFGMSAAGALSAAVALADLLGRSRRSAFEAAHAAEVACRTGLGDISAILRGGITIRARPGLPPVGKVLRIKGEPEFVLTVVGRKLLTKSVLSDPRKREAINRHGAKRVDALIRQPTLDKLMELSSSFAIDSGLTSRKIIEAMSAASKLGMASMSMLGSSVFAVGDTEGLRRVLSDFGDTWVCKVDTVGPRLL